MSVLSPNPKYEHDWTLQELALCFRNLMRFFSKNDFFFHSPTPVTQTEIAPRFASITHRSVTLFAQFNKSKLSCSPVSIGTMLCSQKDTHRTVSTSRRSPRRCRDKFRTGRTAGSVFVHVTRLKRNQLVPLSCCCCFSLGLFNFRHTYIHIHNHLDGRWWNRVERQN